MTFEGFGNYLSAFEQKHRIEMHICFVCFIIMYHIIL